MSQMFKSSISIVVDRISQARVVTEKSSAVVSNCVLRNCFATVEDWILAGPLHILTVLWPSPKCLS